MNATREQLFALATSMNLRPPTLEGGQALRARIATALRRDGFKGDADLVHDEVDRLATKGTSAPAAPRKKRTAPAHAARHAAVKALIEAHPAEFAEQLAYARVKLGLPPEPTAKVKQPTKAELLAEIERLRALVDRTKAKPARREAAR